MNEQPSKTIWIAMQVKAVDDGGLRLQTWSFAFETHAEAEAFARKKVRGGSSGWSLHEAEWVTTTPADGW